MDDMDVLEFARKISMLTIDTPLSTEFDRKYGQKEHRWWSCQREHLTVWCLHYPTTGIKGFIHTPSNSSKDLYNRFGRPETLLWLAEALGESNIVIQNIIDEIKDKKANSACADIRKRIPFNRILELLDNQSS